MELDVYISIIKFCEQNGVPYKQYERWYKTSRGGRPVQVELIDSDEDLILEDQIRDGKLHIDHIPASSDGEKRIQRIEIVFKDGMRIRKTNLDYTLLLDTVQRLSSLC